MNISDLNHLETISEDTHVVGSSSSIYSFGSWLEKEPIEQIVVSENYTYTPIVVSENYTYTPDGKSSAYAATGAYKDGGGFALASAYYVSW